MAWGSHVRFALDFLHSITLVFPLDDLDDFKTLLIAAAVILDYLF